jgi:hypothetical protein
VSAAAEAFAAAPGTRCLLATHFWGAGKAARGASRGVARLRMAGLDREAARAVAADPGLGLAERVQRIGGLMRYEIVREDTRRDAYPRDAYPRDASDALEVAALLGLDEEILAGARQYYSEGDR